jgi:hypothetical protein
MATQEYIITQEDRIIQFTKELHELYKVSKYEKDQLDFNPNNKACWATLSMNLAVLIREAQQTLQSVTDHTGGMGFDRMELQRLLSKG